MLYLRTMSNTKNLASLIEAVALGHLLTAAIDETESCIWGLGESAADALGDARRWACELSDREQAAILFDTVDIVPEAALEVLRGSVQVGTRDAPLKLIGSGGNRRIVRA